MSKNAATREALNEVAAELDEQRRLLEQILMVCRDTADGLNEHRAHTLQQVNDMGKAQRDQERRLRRIEEHADGE